MKDYLSLFAVVLFAGCASYDGRGLETGKAQLADVVQLMGEPALRWQNPDGTLQLAYPRGPMGLHTFMVEIAADGRMVRKTNVLEAAQLARVRPGMTKAQVERLAGPSAAEWTMFYPARDELVWEWRYCNAWNEIARFMVLFDANRETVRSTMSLTEAQLGWCGRSRCFC